MLAEQGRVEGFLNNVVNTNKLSGLVEDIRDAILEYQVCIYNMHTSDTPNRFPLDFATARYLQQKLPTYCGPRLPLVVLSN